jgi:hypothetical protein
MAGVFTADGKNIMLNALAKGTAPPSSITHVSAHSAYPPTAGNEVATARTAIAFNNAAAGTIDDSTNGADIAVGAGTVASIGYWSAAGLGAGTLLAQDNVTDEVFAAPGTYRVTDADLTIND